MKFDKQFILQLKQVFQSISAQIIPLYEGSDSINVRLKKDRSQVTDADIISSRILVEFLSETGYPVLSEEGSRISDGTHEFWVIDPLDGTADFVNHTGDFSFMIAFISGAKPVFGAVYNPLKDIMFYASQEKGAYRIDPSTREDKLLVSQEQRIQNMTLVVSKNHSLPIDMQIAHQLDVKHTLQMGSLGLKAVSIAEQNAHIYFNTSSKTSIWDTAAAEIIISEAGGRITDLKGHKLVYDLSTLRNTNGVVISNDTNHTKILTIIQATIAHEKKN